MSNFDRAVEALDAVDIYIDHLTDNDANDAYVTALEAAGLLAPDNKVVRTIEELETLDPDAVTINNAGAIERVDNWLGESGKPYPLSKWHLPAVVIATGEQVRAAREALEQEHE